MERRQIRVVKDMNGHQEIEEILAIKNDDVIKYIDSENNIMIIDMINNSIKRENNDYIFFLDFVNNSIDIQIKKLKKSFNKSMKTLLIEKNKNSFLVRYQLEDENIYNEYYVNF